MTSIFDYQSYKKFTSDRLTVLPRGGYGQPKRLATFLNVSSTFVSHVLKGDKNFSLEQAAVVCEFLGLQEVETEFFLKLVSLERAGTEKLKNVLKIEIRKSRAESQKISNRLQVKRVLQDEEKAIFYSDWSYSAVRLLSGIEGFQSAAAISDYTLLSRKRVNEIVHFLLRSGLCTEEKGRLGPGPSRTHLAPDSAFIKLHHLNWRMKALEGMKDLDEKKVHYSSPMTLGKKEVEKIKNLLLSSIEEVGKIIDPAPNEELMCLNIDWFPVFAENTT
ncbi:MAG: TIGR02147 family protein [Pseudobdellovibrionaceae bacterium]